MSAIVKERRKMVSLGTRYLTIPQLIQNSRHYVESMSAHPYFPAPVPALNDIMAQTDKLEASFSVAQTSLRGAVDVMKEETKNLFVLVKALAAYVECIANASPPPGQDVIEKAGMEQKRFTPRKPKTFTALNGKIKGEVILDSKARRSSAYAYEMSTDPINELSWKMIYSGTKVKYIQTGLTSGVRYYFRTAMSTYGVMGDWSNYIEVIVL
jgi:hypothetical protein